MTPQQLKAMKLALEALELLTGAWQTFDALDYGDNAITAIKEALAEHAMREVQRLGQEIEQCQCTECQIKPHASDCAVHSEPAYPKGECDCGGIVAVADYTALSDKYVALSDKYVALKAQHKEQEPVAWEAVYETIIHWDECGGKRSRRELARRIVSLYTSPPQRKPLSAEQVDKICAEWTDKNGNTGYSGRRQIVRAIEAAHGIKENT